MEKQNIMAIEQRGSKKDCYGCKDQLMINNAILENCRNRIDLIDCKKAFDSMPHS